MKDSQHLSSLLQRAKAKDDQAFVELYNLFSKHVYYNAIKIVGNSDDAMDVLQEVMLQFYSSLHQIQKPGSLSVYLYRVTYNLSIDHIRKRKNAEFLVGDDELPELTGRERRLEFLPQEYAENREKQEYLMRKLDEMNPGYRAILVMFYYNGLSIKEIAKVLDVAPNVVRVKLQRAREALKRAIERDSREEGALLRAMSLPVLSRIMQQNADGLFTPEINAQVWSKLSTQLGISAGASSTAAAVSATTPGAATTAAGTKAALLLLSAGAAATVIWGSVAAVDYLRGGEHGQAPTNNAVSSGEPAGYDTQSPESSLSGDVPSGESQAGGGTDLQGSSGSAGEDNNPAEPGRGPLLAVTDVLHYPVGTALDLGTVYRDAGVSGIALEEVAAIYLDQVDTGTPNEYGILLIREGSRPYEDYTLAIVIVIE